MKKLCLIALLLGIVFHANANHWEANEFTYPNTMSVVCTAEINGVEQTPNIEIGAFCGDECRGSEIITDDFYAGLNHYAVFLTLHGVNNDQITFRLYDHDLGVELDVTCNTTVTFIADETLGFPDPFVISFSAETPSTFTITATADPAEGGIVSGAGSFNSGATCTLTATANEGYTFVNWTEDDVEVSTEAEYAFTVTGDRDLVANFEESSTPGSGSGTEDDPYDVTAGIALQGESNQVWVHGYIVGVVTNANNVNWNGPFTSNSNVAIADSPDCTDTDLCLYIQLPNNTALRTQVNLKDHPENLGRHLSVKGTLTPYFTPHAGLKNSPGTVNDFHLEIPETFAITATANPTEGGTVSGAGEYESGTSCTLTATANTGYEFTNWTKGSTVVSTDAEYTFTVTEAGDYVANFTVASSGEYHWTFDEFQYATTMTGLAILKINGVEQFGLQYEVGSFCGNECRDTQLPTDEYYEFVSHYLYFINIHGNDGDQITFRLYDHNLEQEVEATCLTTLSFVTNGDLNPDNSPVNPLVIEFVTATIYDITATVEPEESGTVSGAGEYAEGAECTLVASANTGYTFNNWTLNNEEVGTNDTLTFTVTGDAAYVAHFTLNSYIITVAADPTEGGTVEGAGEYNHGDSCMLVATPNSNYVFLNWTMNGEVVSTDAEYSFAVESDGDYVAHFTQLSTYTVEATANPTAGGTISGAGNYVEGTQCTLTATANNGYTFINWTENDEEVSTEAEYSFVVNGNRTLVANFSVNSYTVSVSVNPADAGSVSGSGTFDFGTECELNATPSEGYLFTNWTENGQVVSEANPYTFTVEGNRNLVANFEEDPNAGYHWYVNEYQFPNNMSLIGVVQIDGEEQFNSDLELGVFCGDECRGRDLPMTEYYPAVPHYLFFVTAYGATGDQFTFKLYDHSTNEELDLVCATPAVFVADTTYGDPGAPFVINFTNGIHYDIAVSANPEEGGTVSGAGNYAEGTEVTLTATANEGYTFDSWTVNDSIVVSTDAEFVITVVENAEYVAHFTLNSYEITAVADPEEGGTVEGAGFYNHFSTCTLTATPAEGYHFVNWTLNNEEVGTNTTLTIGVTQAADYVAHFQINSYAITVTANPTEGGTVSGAGTYNHFSNCTLTATPAEGYHFVNWTMNGQEVGTEVTYGFEVTGSASFVAHFEINSYEITATANPEAGGVVTGAGTYEHFSSCMLTATANEGYTFVNWTLNNVEVGTNAILNFTVTEAADYVANFEINSYEITATADPTVGGTVSGAGTYDHFSTCELTATPAEGYHFVNWTLDNEAVGTNAILNFTVTGPASYVAHFEINTYEITATANPTEGGTVDGYGTFEHFSNCTLTATANEGYTFVNWTLNNEEVSTNPTYNFTVTEAANYVANFSLNSYEITATVEPANTGSVSGTGTYNHFDECALTATPAVGYHFVNWTENNVEVSDDFEYSFEVTGPVSLVAHFEINTYEIVAEANPAIGGTATGDGIFTHGQSVTLTAVPADQFIFANWSLNGEVLSTDSIYTFNATQEGLFVANFERVMVTQHTEIHEGWNWYSTYIEQDWLNEQDFNGLNMLEESLGTIGKKIVSQTSSTTYYSNFGWMGGLKYITNEASYRIQATATVNTSVTGPVVHPEDHPITLREGWNWLGYPCTESMSIATAFAGLTPSDRDQVKTVDKSAVYYASFGRWMGRLQTIEPGMGLLYQSNSSTDVVFYYPDEPGDVQREESTIDLHWMANRHAYPDNMTILAVVELDDEELNSEQYEVAAFANGECRGSVPLMYVEEMNRYVAFLVLSGDEVTTLNFGLYNSMTNTECFDSETFVIYSNDAILGDPEEPFVINFRGHTGIDEFGSRLTVFPNPVEHGGVVSLGLNYDKSEVRVEIINTMGSVVYAETTSRMPACITAPSVSGVYTLRITAEGKDACYRKLIVR